MKVVAPDTDIAGLDDVVFGDLVFDAEVGLLGDRIFQANRVGDECPNVGVALQNQRSAFDGGGIGAFTTLR